MVKEYIKMIRKKIKELQNDPRVKEFIKNLVKMWQITVAFIMTTIKRVKEKLDIIKSTTPQKLKTIKQKLEAIKQELKILTNTAKQKLEEKEIKEKLEEIKNTIKQKLEENKIEEKLETITKTLLTKLNQLKNKLNILLKKKKIEFPKNYSIKIKEYFKQSLKELKMGLKKFPESVRNYCEPNTYLWEKVQILCYYLFGLIDLYYYAFSQIVSSSESFEQLVLGLFPNIYEVLSSPIIQFLTSPEKVFILSYVAIEFLLIKDIFNYTVLSKYHFLLVFATIMCQNLIMAFIDVGSDNTIRDGLSSIYTFTPDLDEDAWVKFVVVSTCLLFTWLYIVFFLQGWAKKDATVPGFEWLTDSIALWFQQQRKKNEQKKQEEEENKREENE